MTDMAYLLFGNVPLESFRDQGPQPPTITREMAIDAAVIAYREGRKTSARQIVRALVDATEPPSEDAAERMVREIMDVIRAA